jgi:uncharacterized membrane protein (DUF2068 family)
MPERHDRLILLIGIGKLAKATILVVAAVSVFATLNHGARSWLRTLATGSGRETITREIARLTDSSPHRVELIGAGLLIYAALFTIEGVGLLRRKVWAEWLTILITCSFIPLEIYELIEKQSAMKALVMALNILIALYLIGRRIHASHAHGLKGWLRERLG